MALALINPTSEFALVFARFLSYPWTEFKAGFSDDRSISGKKQGHSRTGKQILPAGVWVVPELYRKFLCILLCGTNNRFVSRNDTLSWSLLILVWGLDRRF